MQRGIWRSLTSPTVGEFVGVHNSYAAGGGVELRLPYLDVRLVEFVIRAPPALRLPHGWMRRLQYEAFDSLTMPA